MRHKKEIKSACVCVRLCAAKKTIQSDLYAV